MKSIEIVKRIFFHNLKRAVFGKSLPYKLEFFLTYRCNSKCRTCNIWAKKNNKKELLPEEIGKIVSSVNGSVLWISLTGGEVFLRQDLDRILTGIVSNSDSIGFVNISTNGLLPEKIKKVLKASLPIFEEKGVFLTITISLDGLYEKYEQIRGVKGGFKKVLESSAILKEFAKKFKNMGFSYEITASRYNINDINKILKFAFLNSYGFSPVLTFSTTSFLLTKGLKPDDAGVLSEKDIDAVKKTVFPVVRKEDTVSKIYLKLYPLYLKKQKAPVKCSAGFSTLTIEPDGEVRRCDWLRETFGNIKEFNFDLKKMYNDMILPELKKHPDCRFCFTPCQAYPSIIDRIVGFWNDFCS